MVTSTIGGPLDPFLDSVLEQLVLQNNIPNSKFMAKRYISREFFPNFNVSHQTLGFFITSCVCLFRFFKLQKSNLELGFRVKYVLMCTRFLLF